jgi:hypothetical protein
MEREWAIPEMKLICFMKETPNPPCKKGLPKRPLAIQSNRGLAPHYYTTINEISAMNMKFNDVSDYI